MHRLSRSIAGFTLIELLVTVAIVGVMASVVLPMMELTVKRGKEQELHAALREIRGGLDAYRDAVQEGRIDHSPTISGYPPNLGVLVEGVDDARSPGGKSRIYFLRRIPRDPFSLDTEVSAEKQWGKRSYASSADSPDEGEDIYDVYSRSTALSISGIAYRDW